MDFPKAVREFPQQLIAAIYEGIDKDDPWADALEQLRLALNCNVACLRISQKGRTPREYLFAAGPFACPEAIREWEAQNARDLLPVDLKVGETRTINWSEVAPASGAYSEILGRYEVGSMATTCIESADSIDCTINVTRPREDPEFFAEELSFLKLVGSHFARAFRLRRELLSTRITSEFQADALDRLGIAAVLVNQSGRAMLLNHTARDHISRGDGLKLRDGRVHLSDSHEDRQFHTAIAGVLGSPDTISRAMSVTWGGAMRNLGMVVTGRDSLSIVGNRPERCALIFLRTAEVASSADIVLLQQLFSFTRTEAKLAIGLAKGMRLEDVESELNIRHNTARAHLRSMFLKTDVNRQSELVHLLANSVAPLGREYTTH